MVDTCKVITCKERPLVTLDKVIICPRCHKVYANADRSEIEPIGRCQ